MLKTTIYRAGKNLIFGHTRNMIFIKNQVMANDFLD